MPKQLYIPLPCAAARRQLIERTFRKDAGAVAAFSEADLCKIVEKTAGYSGSDMGQLLYEASQIAVREAIAANVDKSACRHVGPPAPPERALCTRSASTHAR